MGTDIHLHVEQLVDGRWQEIPPTYANVDGWRSWSPWAESGDYDDPRPNPRERNYNLFAFLADVRNGYGFAGVATFQPIQPQFPERGIPEDTCYKNPDWEVDEDANWLGDHSFTWANLDELLAAPWDMEFEGTGVVTPNEFRVWQEKGIPSGWSGAVMGRNIIIHNDPAEYARMIADGKIRHGENGVLDFCRVSWTWRPLAECGFRRWLMELREKYPAATIRVLMGFDS